MTATRGWPRASPATRPSSPGCSTSPTTWSTRPTDARWSRRPSVVRHDGDDPYLVVAADKGTATFSDIANGISAGLRLLARRRVRLGRLGRLRPQGDGHHRARRLGLGAPPLPRDGRGLPERGLHLRRHRRHVRRRLRQRDAAAPSTSGWSPPSTTATSSSTRTRTRPSSYAERRRLFDLPRSSWQDYDTSLISEGGGVFPRSAKSIPITPQMREALGIEEGRHGRMTPAELMQAILLAPVDLLWNGGIGTYVKARPRPTPRPATRPTTPSASTARAARQVRRRGRQPRPDAARPHRVRRPRAAGSTPTSSTTRPASTPPTTR